MKGLIVGFTGTQAGMTDAQKQSLYELLKTNVREFHHGDCIGADAQAYAIAVSAGIATACHPPVNPKARAFTENDKTYGEREYLTRNKNIVDESSTMIACPKGPEELRSGTWSTVRYARKKGKGGWIIKPDGLLEPILSQKDKQCLFSEFP